MKPSFAWALLAACFLIFSERVLAAAAQEQGDWNDRRVIELIQRAQASRQFTAVDTVFQSYQSEANGYIYFFFDRPDKGGVSLIKADQVALETFWRAPNSTAQHIIGRRDDTLLPTNVQYHLDHLTLVQDNFGDVSRGWL